MRDVQTSCNHKHPCVNEITVTLHVNNVVLTNGMLSNLNFNDCALVLYCVMHVVLALYPSVCPSLCDIVVLLAYRLD